MSRLLQWVEARFPLMSTWRTHFSEYYVPKNLNLLYYFGSLALLVLVLQLLTGLWLTMFYTPNTQLAFDSVESIMRDIRYGWLLRYMHSTGASAFFIIVYLHLFRGLLYGSYQRPRELLWLIGMGLFLCLLMEAFFGYLLPWGQMSYWGAQVITSLFSAIPYIGENLVIWLRGDYHVANATLQRFFALHVAGVPLALIGLTYLHVIALHQVGSNNPEGIEIKKQLDAAGHPKDGIPFHPYYTVKDFSVALVFLMIFFTVVCFFPEMGGYFLEPANFVKADPMVTPNHIAPVWYMTPFYAMLRALPDKLLGVIIMVSAIVILMFLPWLDKSPVKSMRYKGIYSKVALTLMVMGFVLLGYLGTVPVTPVKLALARLGTLFYFGYFLLMPWYTQIEKTQVPPLRISS